MTDPIRRDGDRLVVSGVMTVETASALLAEGVASLASGETLFDLAAVAEVDSSGLAVVFGWLRAARVQGKSLRIVNAPRNLLSLAEVYGVADTLPLS